MSIEHPRGLEQEERRINHSASALRKVSVAWGKTSWPRISPPDGKLSPAPELLTGCMEPGIQTEQRKVGGE